MTKDTGGSAFPSKKRIQRAGYVTQEFEPVDGMSLRDYFAAKAMQSLILDSFFQSEGAYKGWTEIGPEAAEDAYGIADAMLKARAA